MNLIIFCCHLESCKILVDFVPLWQSEIELVVELSKLGVLLLCSGASVVFHQLNWKYKS